MIEALLQASILAPSPPVGEGVEGDLTVEGLVVPDFAALMDDPVSLHPTEASRSIIIERGDHDAPFVKAHPDIAPTPVETLDKRAPAAELPITASAIQPGVPPTRLLPETAFISAPPEAQPRRLIPAPPKVHGAAQVRPSIPAHVPQSAPNDVPASPDHSPKTAEEAKRVATSLHAVTVPVDRNIALPHSTAEAPNAPESTQAQTRATPSKARVRVSRAHVPHDMPPKTPAHPPIKSMLEALAPTSFKSEEQGLPDKPTDGASLDTATKQRVPDLGASPKPTSSPDAPPTLRKTSKETQGKPSEWPRAPDDTQRALSVRRQLPDPVRPAEMPSATVAPVPSLNTPHLRGPDHQQNDVPSIETATEVRETTTPDQKPEPKTTEPMQKPVAPVTFVPAEQIADVKSEPNADISLGPRFQSDAAAQAPVAKDIFAPDPPVRPAVGQIAEAIKRSDGETVEVRLSPEELGRVRLSIGQSDGALHVQLTAERAETLDLMRRNIALLEADLRQNGFANLSFSFGEGNDGATAKHHDTIERAADEMASDEIPDLIPTAIPVGRVDMRI